VCRCARVPVSPGLGRKGKSKIENDNGRESRGKRVLRDVTKSVARRHDNHRRPRLGGRCRTTGVISGPLASLPKSAGDGFCFFSFGYRNRNAVKRPAISLVADINGEFPSNPPTRRTVPSDRRDLLCLATAALQYTV